MMVSLLLSLVFVSQESRAAEEVSIPEWHGAISAIIRTRCGTCHAPDSVGPFPRRARRRGGEGGAARQPPSGVVEVLVAAGPSPRVALTHNWPDWTNP